MPLWTITVMRMLFERMFVARFVRSANWPALARTSPPKPSGFGASPLSAPLTPRTMLADGAYLGRLTAPANRCAQPVGLIPGVTPALEGEVVHGPLNEMPQNEVPMPTVKSSPNATTSSPPRADCVGYGVGLELEDPDPLHPAATPTVAKIRKSSSQVLIAPGIPRRRGVSCQAF